MANTKITSRVLADNAVLTANITDANVTTAKVADNAVTGDKVADDVALAGNPTTTTQSAGNNTTRIATTAFVTTAVANIVDSAPSALDTLNELAAALGDDANFSTTVTNSIAAKLPLAGGTMTGNIIMGDDTSIGIADDAERIEFDGAGDISLLGANVGIGTASPARNLHVHKASSGATSTSDSVLVIEDDDNAEISILGGSSSILAINFGHSGDANDAIIGYNTTSGSENMAFTVNAAERMRITSVGDLCVGGTNDVHTSADIGPTVHILSDTLGTDVSLHLHPDVGEYSLYAYNGYLAILDHTANQERMRLDSSGNVGIGTTSPSRLLEVQLTATNGSLHNNNNAAVHFGSGSGNANSDGYIQGISLGYKTTGANTYAKVAIVARGLNDGAGRQSLAFLVDTVSDGGSAEIGDAKLTINGTTGNVGIGMPAPNANLEVFDASGGAGTGVRINCNNGGSDVWDLYSTTAGRLYVKNPNYSGGVYIQHGATSWTANSDENLKENITSLGTVGDKLKNYRTSYFTWKDDNRETPKRQIGFIAQDWESDFPEVINKMEGEPLGMQYTETIPILLKYIQELEARIKTLEDA